MLMRIGNIQTQDELHHNKMKYCMHKDEIALMVSKPMFRDRCTVTTGRAAYPPVLTTLGNIHTDTKTFLFYVYHNAEKPTDIEKSLIELNEVEESARNAIECLPYFITAGVSLGLAYASPLSGDTVASVMIGGLRTIRNGNFQIYCGDVLQWYWDGEENFFERETGERKKETYSFDDCKMVMRGSMFFDGSTENRKRKHGESNGLWKTNNIEAKINTAYVKPYVEPSDHKKGIIFDKQRVFCKALCDARPFDMVDIMISRQSL
jgi:hypothetical protein